MSLLHQESLQWKNKFRCLNDYLVNFLKRRTKPQHEHTIGISTNFNGCQICWAKDHYANSKPKCQKCGGLHKTKNYGLRCTFCNGMGHVEEKF